MGLLVPRADAVEAIARTIRITDHQTGASIDWRPTHAQCDFWRACVDHPWVIGAKPRQVGWTTSTQLFVMVWAKLNDLAGNRVRAGLYVDTEKKLSERVSFARSVKLQVPALFGGIDVNTARITFPGGSVIELGTGSGESEGRSGSFQLLHLSELPFWQNPDTYGSLLPSLSLDGRLVIETTMDVQAPNGVMARALWWDRENRFHRKLLVVEDHHEYRLDPRRISEEQWARAQREGFTRRDSAAWWFAHALPNLAAGDMARLMREYPQTEGHMFSSTAGLWVHRPTAIATPLRTIDVEGHALHIYVEPADTSGHLVIGVDVAKGAGADASVIAVVDKRDERLVAMLHDNTIRTPPLARAVAIAAELYTRKQRASLPGIVKDPPPLVPEVVVETNGVGTGPVQMLHEAGVGAVDVHLSGAEGRSIIYTCLLFAGENADAGVLAGPRQLAEECGQLHRDPVTGQWKGRKDGLVAYGHAVRWVRLNPYREPVKPKNPDLVDEGELARRMMGSGRSKLW